MYTLLKPKCYQASQLRSLTINSFLPFVLCPDPISCNSNTNSYALRTLIYTEVFIWKYSQLVFLIASSLSLFVHSLFFSSDCSSPEWIGRARSGSVLVVSSLHAAPLCCLSSVDPSWQAPRVREAPGCTRGAWPDHGAGAGPVRGARLAARPRSAASSRALGYRGGAPSQILSGSVRLQPFPRSRGAISPRWRGRRGGALTENSDVSALGHLRRQPSARRWSRRPSPPTDSTSWEPRPPSLFQRLQRKARGESGVHGGGRSDQDTDDGRTDLARGLSLSPPSGSRWVYPKRGLAELRRS